MMTVSFMRQEVRKPDNDVVNQVQFSQEVQKSRCLFGRGWNSTYKYGRGQVYYRRSKSEELPVKGWTLLWKLGRFWWGRQPELEIDAKRFSATTATHASAFSFLETGRLISLRLRYNTQYQIVLSSDYVTTIVCDYGIHSLPKLFDLAPRNEEYLT